MAQKSFFQHSPKEQKSIIIFTFCFFLLIAGCLKCASDSGTKIQQQQDHIDKEAATATVAQQLATIDNGGTETLGLNNDNVIEIQKHLDNLSLYFPETQTEIANATYIAMQQLQRKGLHYSNKRLLVLSDNAGLSEVKAVGITYKEFISLTVSMTSKDE